MTGYDEQITRIASSGGEDGIEYVYLEVEFFGQRYRIQIEAEEELVRHMTETSLDVQLLLDQGDGPALGLAPRACSGEYVWRRG